MVSKSCVKYASMLLQFFGSKLCWETCNAITITFFADHVLIFTLKYVTIEYSYIY